MAPCPILRPRGSASSGTEGAGPRRVPAPCKPRLCSLPSLVSWPAAPASCRPDGRAYAMVTPPERARLSPGDRKQTDCDRIHPARRTTRAMSGIGSFASGPEKSRATLGRRMAAGPSHARQVRRGPATRRGTTIKHKGGGTRRSARRNHDPSPPSVPGPPAGQRAGGPGQHPLRHPRHPPSRLSHLGGRDRRLRDLRPAAGRPHRGRAQRPSRLADFDVRLALHGRGQPLRAVQPVPDLLAHGQRRDRRPGCEARILLRRLDLDAVRHRHGNRTDLLWRDGARAPFQQSATGHGAAAGPAWPAGRPGGRAREGAGHGRFGIPLGPASLGDLRGRRPVAGADHLQPAPATVDPVGVLSHPRTAARARRAGQRHRHTGRVRRAVRPGDLAGPGRSRRWPACITCMASRSTRRTRSSW